MPEPTILRLPSRDNPLRHVSAAALLLAWHNSVEADPRPGAGEAWRRELRRRGIRVELDREPSDRRARR